MGLRIYLIAWVLALVFALGALVRQPKRFEITQRAYYRLLGIRWKLWTFAAATALITGVAPWSGDPTWDATDSILCSVGVFVTAPWSVAVVARARRGDVDRLRLLVACILFFVPCWTYDGYILIRDGFYPTTWSSNLIVSGMITALAGLLWNLDHRTADAPLFQFSFTQNDWLAAQPLPTSRVLLVGGCFAAPVVLMVAYFLYDYFTH